MSKGEESKFKELLQKDEEIRQMNKEKIATKLTNDDEYSKFILVVCSLELFHRL